MDLQKLLDKKGTVHIPSGRYEISKPLIIHSNTHLIMEQDTELYLANGANCSIMDNDGLYTDTQNTDIIIEGGIFNGNNANQQMKTRIADSSFEANAIDKDKPCKREDYIENQYLLLCVRLVNVEHLTVRDVTFKNPTTFATHFANIKYFSIENIKFDYDLTRLNMDGIHIQGPASYGRITGIYGNCNDDHVALCANGTVLSEITHGAIEHIEIDGVYCDNGFTGVRLLSRGDRVSNVTVKNIHGRFRFGAVSLTHHYPLHADKPILLENIHISDVYASKLVDDTLPCGERSPLILLEKNVNVKNVLIENIYRKELDARTTAATVRIGAGVTAENLTIRNIVTEPCDQPLLSIRNDAGISYNKDSE